jgi:hypothetical protein
MRMHAVVLQQPFGETIERFAFGWELAFLWTNQWAVCEGASLNLD